MARPNLSQSASLPEDCTSCGACCFTQQRVYLPLFGVDEARLTHDDQSLVDRVGERHCMRIVDNHCAALRADPATGRLLCSIYPRRPDVCRALVHGSGECLQHHEGKRAHAKAWCDSLRRALGIV